MVPKLNTVSFQESDQNKPLLRNTTFAGPAQASHPTTLTTDINGHTVVSGTTPRPKDSCWTMFLHCLRGNTKYKHFKAIHQSGSLSVSKIDSMARIIFPFSFTCLNILYWAGFIYYFWEMHILLYRGLNLLLNMNHGTKCVLRHCFECYWSVWSIFRL